MASCRREAVTGLGCSALRAASATAFSRTNLMFGIAEVHAPEQAMGEPVGPASDLYSLGVVLYEMLTSEALFRAEYPAAIATELPDYRVKLSRGSVVGSVTFFIFSFFPTDTNPMTEKGTLDPSSRERGKKAANRSHRERNRISLLS